MDKNLAVAVIAITISLSGMVFLSNAGLHSSSSSLTWGPIQSGTVRDTATVKNVFEITVLETSGAVLFINTNPGCAAGYHVNTPILYQVSSVDQTIQTQRIRLVNSPVNCSVLDG